MQTFPLGAETYQVRRMDAFQQTFVLKRLTPILGAVLPLIRDMPKPVGDDATDAEREAYAAALMGLVSGPFVTVLSELKDEDLKFIITAALKVTQRAIPGDGWAAMMNTAGGLMFEDLEFPDLAQITWKALEFNFSRFFPKAAPT